MSLPMVNEQDREQVWLDPNGDLDVIDIWWTIQGEGMLAGHPALFIRLAGCNLQCLKCDTDYTTGRKKMTPESIMRELQQFTNDKMSRSPYVHHRPLVVITGGEPFRQNIVPLLTYLTNVGYPVQVESNGSIFPEKTAEAFQKWKKTNEGDVELLHVTCSPKTQRISDGILPYVLSMKYVIEAGHVSKEDGLPLSVLGKPCKVARPPKDFHQAQVMIQPMACEDDEKNEENLSAAIESCLTFGYRLSMQLHKMIGVE